MTDLSQLAAIAEKRPEEPKHVQVYQGLADLALVIGQLETLRDELLGTCTPPEAPETASPQVIPHLVDVLVQATPMINRQMGRIKDVIDKLREGLL